MKTVEYWIEQGFEYDCTFPGEYDLWVNRRTHQRLRRYITEQREIITDQDSGHYMPVSVETTETGRQKDATTYLSGKNWTSPTEIGRIVIVRSLK